MKLELVSFKLCPFAQRSVIILDKQKIKYDITYIDIMNPPDWFKKISPTGQVPLLKVDDEVIFESAVISEFINDIGKLDMHPTDALQKAKNRAWIELSSSMPYNLLNIVTGDKGKFTKAKDSLFKTLGRIEEVKNKDKFFNGNNFSIIDASIAPIFMRIAWINKFTDDALTLENFNNLSNWSANLLADKDVQNSVVKDLDKTYHANIKNRKGYLSTLLTT